LKYTQIFIELKDQTTTYSRTRPDNRIARVTLSIVLTARPIQYLEGERSDVHVQLIETANENRRRRVRTTRLGGGSPTRSVSAAPYILILRPFSQEYQVPHKSGNSVRRGSGDVIQSHGNASCRVSCRHPTLVSLCQGERETTPRDRAPSIIIVNYHASVARFGR